MCYTWSRYNIVEKIDDYHIIFNTKTSAVIKIDNSNYEQIFCCIKKQSFDGFNQNNLTMLINQGFLVEKSKDEFQLVKARYLKNFYDKNRLNLTILPAEFCNLTCPYCFIYRYAGCSMNEELEKSIIRFVKNRFSKRDKDKKFYGKINWYGGEPLLGKNKIIALMQKINKIVETENLSAGANKIILTSSIITNGVLLSPDTFKLLIENGVSIFQVTFDGGKEYHDLTRCDKNGIGSFDVILQNLKDIINLNLETEFSFSIRIIFLKNNLQSIYPLIDLLADYIGNDKRFTIYCRPVYNFETSRDSISSVESDIFSIKDGLKVQKELSKYISSKTKIKKESSLLDYLIPYARESWCPEDNDYSYIIGANGNLYKCDTLIGENRLSIGTLVDGDIELLNKDSPWIKNIFELKEFEKCMPCKLLPICFGANY